MEKPTGSEPSGALDGYPALDCNPISAGSYKWGDVTLEISPDASKVVIRQAGSNVVVTGGFFQDVSNVLGRCQHALIGEHSAAVLMNCCPTTRSLPIGEWNDLTG